MKIRQTLRDFFVRNEVAWEIFMVILALVFLGINVAEYFVSLSQEAIELIVFMDWGINVFFGIEFVTRLLVAPSWKIHLKVHWLDGVAVLPSIQWFRITRLAYVARLLRFTRLARVWSSLDRLDFDIRTFIQLNGLEWILLGLTGIMIVSASLLYVFESPVNDQIVTFWDALYAAMVTWTTPGYGNIYPITANGRICGLVLIVSGLITWGVLIANLAAFLANRTLLERGTNPAITEMQ